MAVSVQMTLRAVFNGDAKCSRGGLLFYAVAL